MALATLGDSLGIEQVAHQLFRLGAIQTLSPRLEQDGVALRLVLALLLLGVAQHHIQLAQSIHQAA